MQFLRRGEGPKYSEPMASWPELSRVGIPIEVLIVKRKAKPPDHMTADRQWPIVTQEIFLTEEMVLKSKKKCLTDDDEVLALFVIINGGLL